MIFILIQSIRRHLRVINVLNTTMSGCPLYFKFPTNVNNHLWILSTLKVLKSSTFSFCNAFIKNVKLRKDSIRNVSIDTLTLWW